MFMTKERYDETMENKGKKLTPCFNTFVLFKRRYRLIALFQLFMVIFAKIFLGKKFYASSGLDTV